MGKFSEQLWGDSPERDHSDHVRSTQIREREVRSAKSGGDEQRTAETCTTEARTGQICLNERRIGHLSAIEHCLPKVGMEERGEGKLCVGEVCVPQVQATELLVRKIEPAKSTPSEPLVEGSSVAGDGPRVTQILQTFSVSLALLLRPL